MQLLDAPCFFTLAVTYQFRYPVWGHEPGSLTHRLRRLLTQERIFSPAYYYEVGAIGNALKIHIISAGLWLTVFTDRSVYLRTAVGIISPVEFANQASHFQHKFMGKSRPHSAASNCLYLFVWANLCILFILFLKPTFCNGPETEMKWKIGIQNLNNICILSYIDSWCLVPFSSNISCDRSHNVRLCCDY